MANLYLEVPRLPSTKAMRSLLNQLLAYYEEKTKALENWDEGDEGDDSSQYDQIFLCFVLNSEAFGKHHATPYMLEYIDQLLYISGSDTLWSVFRALEYPRLISLETQADAKTEVKLRKMWITDLLANFPGQP